MPLSRVTYPAHSYEPGLVVLQAVIAGADGANAAEPPRLLMGKGDMTVAQAAPNAVYVLTIPGFNSNNPFTVNAQLVSNTNLGAIGTNKTVHATVLPATAPTEIRLQVRVADTGADDDLDTALAPGVGIHEEIHVTVCYKNSSAA